MGCLILHRTALHQAASSCIFDAHHISKHACACRFLHSWMAALQLLLVCFTMLALLGLVPLLYFLGHWYLAQQSPLEAGESPQRSLSRRWSAGFRTPDAKLRRENGKEAGQTGSEEVKPADLPGGPADEEEAPGSGDAKLSEDGAAAKSGSRSWLGLCKVGMACCNLACTSYLNTGSNTYCCPLSPRRGATFAADMYTLKLECLQAGASVGSGQHFADGLSQSG